MAMPTDVIDRVRLLDQAVLFPVVRGVLNDESATPISGWTIETIGGSVGPGTLGIFRIAGEANTDRGPRPWSVVAKVLDLDATSEMFAKVSPVREINAYESGLLTTISSTTTPENSFRAAKHYGVKEIDDLGSILWVEDLSAAPPLPWDDDTYLEIARQIGHFNANWELNPPEKQPWFLSDLLATYRQTLVNRYESIRDYLDDSFVQRVATPEVIQNMVNLTNVVPSVNALLNTGPRPLSHLDAQPRNLFPIRLENGGIETVAIDWSSVGYAPLGTDAALVIGSTMTWFDLDAEHGVRLHTRALSRYLGGLEETGWHGNTNLVRLAYMTAAVRRAEGNAMLPVLWVDEPDWKGRTVDLMHKSPEALVDHWRDVFAGVYPLFEKERTSMGL